MGAPNVESLKRVFCTMATDRNKVSIPRRVSSSVVSKEGLNSVENRVSKYYHSKSDEKAFARAYIIGPIEDANTSTMPYDRDKHPSNFCTPLSYLGARMIGGGRDYLGRRFVVISEAETSDRTKPGLIEFDDGERILYLSEKYDLNEDRRYRLDGGLLDSEPSAVPVFRITDVSWRRNDD